LTRTVYLNGAWLPETEAKVSVFDRGFLFADAIYEVTAVIGGKLIDYYGHAALPARFPKRRCSTSTGTSSSATIWTRA